MTASGQRIDSQEVGGEGLSINHFNRTPTRRSGLSSTASEPVFACQR
jgi:hypothetical protein